MAGKRLLIIANDLLCGPSAELPEDIRREVREADEVEHRGTESFSLLKDVTQERHFVSLGVWSGHGPDVQWGAFLKRLGRRRALCEPSHSHTFKSEGLLSRSRQRAIDLAA